MVARAGASAQPPVPAPTVLRRFLSFQRLPPTALEATRRALDEDAGFRGRVHDSIEQVVADPATDETSPADAVGEAGWLLLDRPPGWEDRLEALLDHERRRADEAADARRQHRAERRLERTEAELARVADARDAAVADADAARTALAEAVARHDHDAARIGDLEAEVAELEAARAEAVRQLKAAEQRVAERALQLRRARAELDEVRHALAAAEAEVGQRDDGGVGPEGADPGPPPDPAERRAERQALADAVAAASVAADELSAALERARRTLGVDAPAPRTDAPPAPPASPDAAGSATGGRQPAQLPVGIFDDSAEAALFLLRLPAAVLVVDGYNVSMTGWPDQPLPGQRRRLVYALRNLQARTGVEPVVVFDGVEPDSGPAGSLPRSVQIRFSPPGVTADDVVVELVDQLPADRPVVVASSDREVRQRVAARGANTVASAQLVGLLRSA